MVLREYFHVIVRHLLSSKQSLNIREESLLLVLHMQMYVMGILIIKTNDERRQIVSAT